MLAFGAKVSAEFRRRVLRMALHVGVDPSWLMAIMAFETGRTFSPSKRNALSGATGLIQFIPSTAIDLNTTTDALAAMTDVEQLDYVERYFSRYAGRMQTLASAYMAVLWPRAVSEPDSAVIFEAPSKAYAQNRALDTNNDGKITKAEAAAFVARALAEGMQYATEERDPRTDAAPPRGNHMGALAALQLFGPILAGLIPQIASILKPESEVAKRNVGLAQTIVDTITKTANAPNLQAAVESMQADSAVKDAVQKAVVTEPTVITTLQISEIGGGIAGARQADAQAATSDKPFYRTSAVFWVSVLLIPLVYWLVGSLIVGGTAERLIAAATDSKTVPEWVTLLLSLFGSEWTGEARSGGFNLVVGLVLGGICGVYYGISVTQQKQQGTAATPPKEA